jgi:hypothetical protein
MTTNVEITADIAAVEKRIAIRETELKELQSQWRDWEAGNLRTLIGGDKRLLVQLRGQLAATKSADSGIRSSQMFYAEVERDTAVAGVVAPEPVEDSAALDAPAEDVTEIFEARKKKEHLKHEARRLKRARDDIEDFISAHGAEAVLQMVADTVKPSVIAIDPGDSFANLSHTAEALAHLILKVCGSVKSAAVATELNKLVGCAG